MQHRDHRDHVLAPGHVLQRGGIHGDIRKACAPGRARLAHGVVDVDAMCGGEVLYQHREELAAAAADVQRFVAPCRQACGDPRMEGVVVASRVPGVRSVHAGGGSDARPGTQSALHLHAGQCRTPTRGAGVAE